MQFVISSKSNNSIKYFKRLGEGYLLYNRRIHNKDDIVYGQLDNAYQ